MSFSQKLLACKLEKMLYLGVHEVCDALKHKVPKLLQLESKVLRAVASNAFLPALIVPYYVILKSLHLFQKKTFHSNKN